MCSLIQGTPVQTIVFERIQIACCDASNAQLESLKKVCVGLQASGEAVDDWDTATKVRRSMEISKSHVSWTTDKQRPLVRVLTFNGNIFTEACSLSSCLTRPSSLHKMQGLTTGMSTGILSKTQLLGFSNKRQRNNCHAHRACIRVSAGLPRHAHHRVVLYGSCC